MHFQSAFHPGPNLLHHYVELMAIYRPENCHKQIACNRLALIGGNWGPVHFKQTILLSLVHSATNLI